MSTNTNQQQSQTTLQRVQEIGEMAGITLVQHPSCDMLVCHFDMGGGRTQNVYIRHCGTTPDGQDVVCFMSPCMTLEKGFLKGMGKNQAIDLLQRNAQLLFARFAIQTLPDGDLLVVCSDQIVDTMEVDEFKHHLFCVGGIADNFEKEHGRDMF
ncbi:MAG: hypothetical protein D8M59_01940 [Planctomycetes bacterium]|nr:hypothetical protein [Planctomycetota bacterium]NOG54519.1 hypothetical protein [Planctomycetota bacterium]